MALLGKGRSVLNTRVYNMIEVFTLFQSQQNVQIENKKAVTLKITVNCINDICLMKQCCSNEIIMNMAFYIMML